MSAYDFSRVLTIGASGMIGSYIDFGIRPDRKKLDILDHKAVAAYIRKHKPTAIIHLAAATDMTRCEAEPEYAFNMNALGTYHVATAARDVGATVVYLSTSRVFEGNKKSPYTEKDIPNPQGQYARSKYLGEIITAALVPDHLIIRTCWVFGGGPERDDKFYGKVLMQLGEKRIDAVDDVHGSPTFAKDLVVTIKDLLKKKKHGTFHVSNAGSATRYDIAHAIVRDLKPEVDVRAVHRSHFKGGSKLPQNEAIKSQTIQLRPWREALSEYLEVEWRPYLRSHTIIV